ncbi:ABC transporter ATP-binding protein [Mycetocola tolaasinivorans]|uniref:ABC transporter ATP-binding protein n=1 Tax=Mycetocola tolaasinivorans TaxID=76635 RepID=A0A3L7A790_9MICO|nr:ABC transporter ATP-binding protein [Mycetocola tolaasinivorans]RLP75710.1 ABC transporter ATP-binding protein [Mycetocola tolaasinivorans]
MNTLLTLDAVTKTFGSRTILDRVSLDVVDGESLAIVGPSGSGKSTLLNVIGLLDGPTSGEIRFSGTPLPRINSAAATLLRRDHINYLFQSFALISSATALENILIGMHAMRERRAAKIDRAMGLLERLGLLAVAQDRVVTLSGGERQRVALARCLLKPGELILADEPTGALDSAMAEIAITEMLTLHRDFGKTLLVVTHDARVARRCDRVYEIGTGITPGG